MAVPYTFGTSTSSIPLSQLDSNFATAITIGNTAVYLGNTTTSFGNVTLTNATISSLSTPITVAQGGTGLSSTPTAGQIDIGNGTGFTRSTLTAGSNITITNGNGTVTIASTAGGGSNISNGTSNVSIASANGAITMATAGSTAVTVDTSQNVGIGTTSPSQTLEVSASNPTRGIIARVSNSAGSSQTGTQLWFNQNGVANWVIGQPSSTDSFAFWNGRTNGGDGTERMRIDSSGNLLVGTTSATGHFTLKQSSNNYGGSFALVRQDTTDNWQFRVDGGSTLLFGYNSSDRGSFNSGTGAYTALSDRNKKKDFEDSTIGLSAVMQLKPTLYRMIDEEETSDKHLGFIAQEVKEVIPPAYVELGDEDNKFIGLDYQPIVASLVKAIQELTAEVEALKAKVGA
jgi:hypothetical protein